MGGFDEGLITSILGRFDPNFRPVIEIAILALLAGAAISAALNPILDFIFRVWRFLHWLSRQARRQLRNLLGRAPTPPSPPTPTRTIPEEQTIWEKYAPSQPSFPDTRGVPIITIANMKGGVGKTTIAANLAVYFRDKFKKPVLLIDFDYQGSLSQTVRGEAGYTEPDLTADILISEPTASIEPSMYAREMRRGLENVFIYPTNYPFATIENNLMADWLDLPCFFGPRLA